MWKDSAGIRVVYIQNSVSTKACVKIEQWEGVLSDRFDQKTTSDVKASLSKTRI